MKRNKGNTGWKPEPRDRRLVRDLVRWFEASARDLPWRRVDPATGRRDPYVSLESEVMLQQTQVSRVLERFGAFIGRFPTAGALAAADEADVLAAWSGLGYYRRARLLHRAAKAIEKDHGGKVPDDPALLRALPGVGRYTAGAVASICFGRAEPIVDGNVKRVLMRLDARRGAQSGPEADSWAWERAGGLVQRAARGRPPAPGAFNEALMELGATVCTPRAPRCAECPVRGRCGAFRLGLADRIPRPRLPVGRKVLFCASVVAVDRAGRLLVERRPDLGMWAGLWQAPTLESFIEPGGANIAGIIGEDPGEPIASFNHGTTHRDVRFSVWRPPVLGPAAAGHAAGHRPGARWLLPDEIAELALSSPQRRILLRIGAGQDGRVGSGGG